MNGKVIVRARIKIETLDRIRAVRRIPSRENGHRHKPDYFGGFIDDYVNTQEFEIEEKEKQIEKLKGQVGSHDFVLKIKAKDIEKAKSEIQALKRRIAELETNTEKKAVNE